MELLGDLQVGLSLEKGMIGLSKIKVLCLSIWYPLAMSRYFEKAFRHRDDLDFKTAGVYTGNWIPWLGGMNLLEKYAIPPDVPLPFPPNIGEINYEIIKAQLGNWVPDLIIQVDAGLHFKYKPVDGMTVTVGTDPHVLNEWYDTPRKYSDKFFSMQLCYSKSDDLYLPYAYSQYDHYPVRIEGLEDGTWKDVDAVLIGMPYPQRVHWMNKLRENGITVLQENGPVFDEARALYNRGRIGLNWSSMDDLNARFFELPAMKLAPVVNHVSDAHLFGKKGEHYLEFSSLDESLTAVRWLKDNPEECSALAQRAYDNIQGQTYDSRVEQILKECKFL